MKLRVAELFGSGQVRHPVRDEPDMSGDGEADDEDQGEGEEGGERRRGSTGLFEGFCSACGATPVGSETV